MMTIPKDAREDLLQFIAVDFKVIPSDLGEQLSSWVRFGIFFRHSELIVWRFDCRAIVVFAKSTLEWETGGELCPNPNFRQLNSVRNVRENIIGGVRLCVH